MDERFDVLDLGGAKCVLCALGVTSEAGVIRVGLAVPVPGDLHDHPESAVAAVHGRFQIVVVLDRAFAVDLLFRIVWTFSKVI